MRLRLLGDADVAPRALTEVKAVQQEVWCILCAKNGVE